MHHTPTPQIRAFRRTTQRRAIRAAPPQHRRLIIIPVVLAEVEAAVLGPEEEPDAGEHEADADQGEDGENCFVGDVDGVDDAGGGVGGAAGDESSCGEGGRGGGSAAEEGGEGLGERCHGGGWRNAGVSSLGGE